MATREHQNPIKHILIYFAITGHSNSLRMIQIVKQIVLYKITSHEVYYLL